MHPSILQEEQQPSESLFINYFFWENVLRPGKMKTVEGEE